MRTARKARLSRMMAKAEQDKFSSLVTTRRGPSSRNHDHAGKPKPRTRPAIEVVLKMLGRERDDQVAMNGRRRAHNDNQTPVSFSREGRYPTLVSAGSRVSNGLISTASDDATD
jgi:hypothetical protein